MPRIAETTYILHVKIRPLSIVYLSKRESSYIGTKIPEAKHYLGFIFSYSSAKSSNINCKVAYSGLRNSSDFFEVKGIALPTETVNPSIVSARLIG